MVALLLLALSVSSIETLANTDYSVPALDPFYYFDVQLAEETAVTQKGNWVASPASIKSALGLLLEAANKNTANEICQMLRLPTDLYAAREKIHEFHKNLREPAQKVQLKIGNKILVRQNLRIRPKYRKLVSQHFAAEASPFNTTEPWKVSSAVNAWVKSETDSYISEIMKPSDITGDSILFLVSVVYFKADWRYPFDPESTQNECFYNPVCKKVPMMTTTGSFRSGELPNLNAQVIELPYQNPRYSLVLLVPKERNGLSRLIWDLPFNPILNILDSLPETDLDVTMPKFSIKTKLELQPLLEKFGMKEIFTDNADLSDLLRQKGKVSSFMHHARIDVNEKGTIAGAASVAGIQLLTSAYNPRIDVNHPFFFFIRDRLSGFLFEGQVTDPEPTQVISNTLTKRGIVNHNFTSPRQRIML